MKNDQSTSRTNYTLVTCHTPFKKIPVLLSCGVEHRPHLAMIVFGNVLSDVTSSNRLRFRLGLVEHDLSPPACTTKSMQLDLILSLGVAEVHPGF